ncbi:hypothetical protein EKD04_025530 [Chloroflexales bacterium ZM16-3]|nr:hypothetical protein [Chloroflexales bacterium ZM16-3]
MSHSRAADHPVPTLIELDDGSYQVRWSYDGSNRAVAAVYEDAAGGWRPYNAYGHVLGAGQRSYATPILAAYGPQDT